MEIGDKFPIFASLINRKIGFFSFFLGLIARSEGLSCLRPLGK